MKVTEPIVMGRLSKWPGLLWKNRAPDRPFIKRLGLILTASTLTFPFRVFEKLRFQNSIKKTPVHKSPLFILGFWRSGTTYLHNCLCEDSTFGYLSLFQTLAPDFFLTTEWFLKPLFSRITPQNRPMDAMALTIDSPQEEELALFNVTNHSLYHQMFFPKNAWYYFRKYGHFDSLSKREFDQWRNSYMMLLKKLSYYYAGKRLVLKNPAHLGRIHHLLKLFPDAKFIHLYRNPYRIYPSTLHMFRQLVPICQLQEVDWKEIEAYILFIYQEMMGRYFAECSKIPSDNLMEISFEKFEQDPLYHLGKIYRKFNMNHFEAAESSLHRYINAQRTFTKNEYCIDQTVINTVNTHWKPIVEKLGYATRT